MCVGKAVHYCGNTTNLFKQIKDHEKGNTSCSREEGRRRELALAGFTPNRHHVELMTPLDT